MIILTGGAGFIGSCLLAELNKQGYSDILVVDNLGNGAKWKNLANKRFTGFMTKEKFRAEVLCSGWTEFGELFKKSSLLTPNSPMPTAIIHLGACSSTTEPDANYLMDNNFLYTKELAMFAMKNNIRFIYASSAATYGGGENGYSDKSIDGLVPLNAYGMSKHIFDMWAMENGFDKIFTGIKFFNVFGPNEYHKGSMQSMFLRAFQQIKDTGKVKLFRSYLNEYGDGEQKRDFIYVKDCTTIILKMMKDKNFTGIYNVGTGNARTWNALAKSVFTAMNKDVNIEYIDMPDNIAKQYQYFTEADTTKIMAKLGENWKWTSIEDAAIDYIQNYLANTTYL
ncbi:MAG: ADP-glyceromanno-heptose 6-epimerase [Ignavibacteria bacterium]|jgi:ADP-L-glycero-D-manno-heptose 6-epimerase|nr:ADP-glyceromanno-heptose 6-epimerase [Ignavibacteria bacterium]